MALETETARPAPNNVNRWFAENILPLEPALMRYLKRHLQHSLSDVADFRQDIYIAIYEHAKLSEPHKPISYLFQTARNYLCDYHRRMRIVSINYTDDLEVWNELIDEVSPDRRLSGMQDLHILAHALNELSDVCREVIWLRRVAGLSQKEVARQLGMKEGTVESHVCRGLKILANALFSAI